MGILNSKQEAQTKLDILRSSKSHQITLYSYIGELQIYSPEVHRAEPGKVSNAHIKMGSPAHHSSYTIISQTVNKRFKNKSNVG
jgi:hypothetical protein